jgi:lipopolysaccharide/colanic/teichoic acid biosynthesis glycosyltransferase
MLGLYHRAKPTVDAIIALALFVPGLPLMALGWLLVKLTSRGPGTYTQVRVGRHGRLFRIYKLRTMYHDCEARTGARWCVQGDPRITPVGRWLRRLHVDELPQLWNVLLGHMSLVGPRPERPEFVGPLDAAIAGYAGRLAVKPGVTGLAQVQLPPDTDLESVRAKLALDLCYVTRCSAWLDFRIMLGTALYLAGLSYAGVRRAMALPGASVGEPPQQELRMPQVPQVVSGPPEALVGV